MQKKFLIYGGITAAIVAAITVFFILTYTDAYYIGYPRIAENDRYCSTFWIVYHDVPLDHLEIENFLRKEISQFGSEYDIPWREITIKQIDANSTSITVQGSWLSKSERPNLQEKISQIEEITKTEKTRGICS